MFQTTNQLYIFYYIYTIYTYIYIYIHIILYIHNIIYMLCEQLKPCVFHIM